MDHNIPTSVLSEEISKVINNRKIISAVFLTYQFDPGFFEINVLPILFNASFSQVPKIKLIQLDDVIRSINVAVYYDCNGLIEDEQSSKLPYKRIALFRNTGKFHPKNILLLIENKENDQVWKSLVIITMSANLTESGWWTNVEVAHIEEVHDGAKCSYRQDLLDLISCIKKEDCTGEDHAVLESIRSYLYHNIYSTNRKEKDNNWLTRFYCGNESVPDFIYPFIYDGDFNLEVISPFFEKSNNATTLRSLIDHTAPKNIRIHLPKDKDGSAIVDERHFQNVKEIKSLKWSILPANLTRASSKIVKDANNYRFVHAKVYRFWSSNWEVIFIGSPNLTSSAYSKGNAGNFETGVILEIPDSKTKRDWWLSPISEDEQSRLNFKPSSESSEDIPFFVSIKFDWYSSKLSYFWKFNKDVLPLNAKLIIQGIEISNINKIHYDEWIKIDLNDIDKFKEYLQSTSFLQIETAKEESFTVLIREERMEHKPSILFTLTVEEILLYWSLLTADQREAFLYKKFPETNEEFEKLQKIKISGAISTFFDKFAGIFHAFKKLEDYLADSLENGKEKDAVYRLLGEKYDSLPSLIQKVQADIDGDLVNKYITLLCANQIIDKISKLYPDFKNKHKTEFKEIKVTNHVLQEVKDQFKFASEEEKNKFFNWFENMFLLEIPLPKADLV